MPSDDFWADLPSEKGKKISPPKKGDQPEVAVPKSLTTKQRVDVVSTDTTPINRTTEPISSASAEEVPEEVPMDRNFSKIFLSLKLVLAMVFGAILGVSLLLAQGVTSAADQIDSTPTLVTIERGTTSYAVATELEQKGLLISRWPFLLYVRLTGQTIKAGAYSLTQSLTPRQIVTQLAEGKTSEQSVTIPEGWRLEQIAALLSRMGIITREDFLEASRYDPVRYTLPAGISREVGSSLEGLLFPDTYRFAYGVTSKEVVAEMLANFTKRTAALGLTEADLILASIVEREAKLDTDRAPVAGVYANRLKQNIKLQADPTVQYGKETLALAAAADPTTLLWWQPILIADYQAVKSPFNTYLITGLPPTPIANPGLKSLEAAKNPTDHDYFYFFHKIDGTTVFSKTAEEHLRAQRS